MTLISRPGSLQTKEWFDYRAPLTPGSGCSGRGPVSCPYGRSMVYLGDQDDVAHVDSVGGEDNAVYGEAGDDEILAAGRPRHGDTAAQVTTRCASRLEVVHTPKAGSGNDRICTTK